HAARFCDSFQPDGLLRQRTPERDTLVEPTTEALQSAFGAPQRAHAMVNPARPEPSLSSFESATFAEQDVFSRHPQIVKDHFHMSMRCVVVPKHGQRA